MQVVEPDPWLREVAQTLWQAALTAVEPAHCVARQFNDAGAGLRIAGLEVAWDELDAIRLLAVGKAALGMARPVQELLGSRISGGLVVVPAGQARSLGALEVREATHPRPGRAGLLAARRLIRQLGQTTHRTLVLALISGGASALLPCPAPGLSLADKQQTTDLLLRSGAAIDQVNALRKHLSRLKGGGLLRVAHPAQVIGLLLSDVPGDDPTVIGSGLTAADPTTYAECLELLARWPGLARVPGAVRRRLAAGLAGQVPETLKPGDPLLDRVHNRIVAGNGLAVQAAAASARQLGWLAEEWPGGLVGEARDAARRLVSRARELAARLAPGERGCLIAGGETTVTWPGEQTGSRPPGGRNQELALAASFELAGLEGICLLAAGTDGRDGSTPAAGGWADGGSLHRGQVRGLDPAVALAGHAAHAWLARLGDLFITGPTGTNVADLAFVLVKPLRTAAGPPPA